MSLHATLSPEAEARLLRQKRLQTASSLTIAALFITLLMLLLGWFILPAVLKESPTITVTHIPGVEERELEITKKTQQLVRKPTPAAAAAMTPRTIAAEASSAVSIPIPDLTTTTEFADFGDGMEDFGSAWQGDGFGEGGGGSAFGSTQARNHALAGSLYDFKQDSKGRAVKYNTGNLRDFTDRAERLQRSRFRDTAFRDFFRAPQTLYLTHLAVPFSSAADGPKFFEAADSVKPSGWVAHYRGTIRAPKDGHFRFVGHGDDYLVVNIENRPRLIACWPDTQEAVRGSWKAEKPSGEHMGPFHQPLIYGDWISMREGEEFSIDIAAGERPGGKVGFVLMIEERGANYQKEADGRPILPLFTLEPLFGERRAEIEKSFGSFKFEWDNVPVFGKR